MRVPGFKAGAAFDERQRAQVFISIKQQIVEADVGRIIAQHFGGHGLTVQALLQIVEWRHFGLAHDEQFAVSDAVLVHEGGANVGERGGDVVALAREHFDLAAAACDLHADAVPFPFGGEILGAEFWPVAVFDWVRQHHGAEHRLRSGIGFGYAAFEPGKHVGVGRFERVPDFFDFRDVAGKGFGDRRFGEPGRDTDTRRATQQFEQCPAAR